MKRKGLKILTIFAAASIALCSGSVAVAVGNVAKAVEAAIVTTPDVSAASSIWSGMSTSSYGTSFATNLRAKMAEVKTKTSSYDDLKTILTYSDLDPAGSGKMLGFYDEKKLNPVWDGGSTWNREHVWPNSRGVGKSGPGSDPHMIRPADSNTNGDRGNLMYGTTSSSYDPGQFIEYYRGIASRIILYTALYYGTVSGGGDLKLSDNTGVTTNTMGRISNLLDWNAKYPVQPSEVVRNEYLYANGYGRNPFIDNPEFASYIWTTDSSKGGTESNGFVRTAAYSGGEYNYSSTSDWSSSTKTSTVSSSSSSSSSSSISTPSSTSSPSGPQAGTTIRITSATKNMPTAYPSPSAEYSLAGLDLMLYNVAAFTSNPSVIQIKKSTSSAIYNAEALPFISKINISVAGGTAPTVKAGLSKTSLTAVTPSNEGSIYSYDCDGATYFDLSNTGSVLTLNYIEFVFAGGDEEPPSSDPSSESSSLESSSSSLAPAFARRAVLIDDLSDIEEGDEIVLGTGDSGSIKTVTTTIKSTYYLASSTAEVSAGVIETPDASSIWTIESGESAGTYALKCAKGYLKAYRSGAYLDLGFENSLSDESTFTMIENDGEFTIKYDEDIFLEYHEERDRFSAYSLATPFFIYRLVDESEQFATTFLSSVLCTGQNVSFPSSLWTTLSISFLSMVESQRNVLKNAHADADGTIIEKCVARYDLIVCKYGADTYPDFMDRNPSSFAGFISKLSIEANSQVLFFALIGLAAIVTAGIFVVNKKH